MRDRPHPDHKLEWPGGVVPEWARPKQGGKKRFGKGGGGKAERQGGSSPSKRERLQKVMAQSGHGSRRNIEILIAQGHITINGQVAKLGDAVGPGDKVKLDGNLIQLRFGVERPRVLMYHKPEGEIVTRDDPEKRATVFDKLPKVHGGRWVSVGRLDLNTGGLLLFTTSGDLANNLTHPRFEVEREYAVRVMGEVTDEAREKLLKTGVDIDGESCTFDSIEDRGGEGSNHWYHVVLREGKNREVRRMMEAVGLMVSRLMRVRFGPVALPGFLKRGMMREMDEDQVIDLMAFAGTSEGPPPVAREEVEEDEHDNVGNRMDAQPHHARVEREIDDDFGNRVHAPAQVHEADGNRGTYNPNAVTPAPRGQGQRQGKGGPGGQRGQGGEGGQRPGQGQPRHSRKPHGGKPFAFKKRGPGQGGQGQPHAQGQQPGQGQPPRQHGQGEGQGQQPGQGPAPGQGKPGRHRNRNRNRNRNRGGGAGGGNAGGGGHEARGDQQPQNNGNREPS